MGDEKPKEGPWSRSLCGVRDFAFRTLENLSIPQLGGSMCVWDHLGQT